MGVLPLNLIANSTHSLIKRGFIKHLQETGCGHEIDGHQELKWRLADFFDFNFHFSDEALPFWRQSNKTILGIRGVLDLISFLGLRDLDDVLLLLLTQLLDLVKEVVLLYGAGVRDSMLIKVTFLFLFLELGELRVS